MKQRSMSSVSIIVAILLSIGFVAPARAEAPAKLEERLDAIAKEAYPNENEPGAAVIVVVDGKPVLRKGYGLADVESGAKNTPEKIFRIASVTKQFTAVAILQLVQQGKVRLDDPITKYVADFDMRGKTITIEHLLTHTSGIPNFTATPGFIEGETRKLSPRELVAIVDGQPLDFEPGSKFKYSNTELHAPGHGDREGERPDVRGLHGRARVQARRDEGHALQPQRHRGRAARAAGTKHRKTGSSPRGRWT